MSALAIPTRRRPSTKRLLLAIGNHAVLIAFAVMFGLPFLYMLLQAVMPTEQARSTDLIPGDIAWSNFSDVFERVPFARYVLNTIVICALTTIGTVVSCVPVAYAFARMQWRWRQPVFIFVLGTMMIPGQVTFVSLYQLFSDIGWVPGPLPLIVPSFLGDAFSIFLLRQFFLTIPEELADAARVDGAGEFRILTRVVVPLARPAIMAVALFNWLFAWGDFFGPLIYLQDADTYTLAIGIQQLSKVQHTFTNANLVMTASILFVVPIIVLFFFAQKVFIEGVTLTGVKG